MSVIFPKLPYSASALAPHISADTLETHHGKHHKSYVDKVNDAIKGTDLADAPLEDIIRAAHENGETKLFNNAAQSWNHQFYWESLSPDGGDLPKSALADAIKDHFGGLDDLKKQLQEKGEAHFGSGWVWLVADADGALSVEDSHDAGLPWLGDAPKKALLTLDLWEHAYYLDRKNERPKYLKAAIDNLINWQFAADNFARDDMWCYPS